MKTVLFLAFMFQMLVTTSAQEMNTDYDSTLAKQLGADDYGMKTYVFVMLKTGSNTLDDKTMVDSLFSGHLANINRLANEGLLVVAGPMGKNENNYRGIFILNISSMEEAKNIIQTDPAIKAKLLDFDLYKWYGSAAISEYLKVHDKIEKYKIGK